jgi:5-methylcytosine-specific restriction protein A
MANALFINGIYGGVLTEILSSQESRRGGESFLQPYKGTVITMMKRQPPSPHEPIRLYVSTTDNLSQICYMAEIIGWEDKREMSDQRRESLRQHFEIFQPGDIKLFDGSGEMGQRAVNLITIRSLRQLETLHSTSILRKVSDGLPLRKRTRSGGWSEVFDLGELINLPSDTMDRYDRELAAGIQRSTSLTDADLHQRLSAAPKIPGRIQIVSIGFLRNPDVIVAVLRRAKGRCERCAASAPFLRRSDGSPYLEVHHWRPLSQEGEDTIENAAALCPNCHRDVHHGVIVEL